MNPGRLRPIPVRPGHFGPISRASRLGPTGAGRFGPVSKVGRYGQILVASRFRPDLFILGKTGKILG